MNIATTPRSKAHQQLHRLLPGLMPGLFMAALDQTIVAAVPQGIGAGGLMDTSQTLVGDLLEPAERGR